MVVTTDPHAFEYARSGFLLWLRTNIGRFMRDDSATLSEVHIPNFGFEPGRQHDYNALIVSVAWSLVNAGFIIPGRNAIVDYTGTVGFDSFPGFRVTPKGRALLQSGDPDPDDYEGYLADARSRLGQADERIYVYLAAATRAFQHGDQLDALSGTVMLGVSAELLIKWLIEAFLAHLPENKRGEFERTRNEFWMRTNRLFEVFINAFGAHYGEFAPDLKYHADATLDQVQTLIRVNRDDVGHGRPQRVDRTMLHGHLISYLTLLSVTRELADAWEQPCTKYHES